MASSKTGVCYQIFTAYPISDLIPGIEGQVGIGGVILGFVYFLSAALTIFWIKQQQFNAQQGMEGAAMHVIFPIYLPFLWSSSISDALAGLVILFTKINFRGTNPWSEAVPAALVFTLQHFVIEGTAFVLMQYGCGYRAVKNAFRWAIGWSISSFIVNLLLYRDGSTNTSYAASLFWNLLQLLFYGTLWFAPETKLFRREAVIFYARFWFIFRVCVVVQQFLFKYGTTDTAITASNCIDAIVVLPVFILFKPFVVYTALLRDSQWWQGLSRANQGVNSSSNANTPSGGSRFSSRLPTHDGQSSRGHLSMIKKVFLRTLRHASHSSDHNTNDSDEVDNEENGLLPDRNNHVNNNNMTVSQPLLGVEVGFQEAQELGQAVDKLRKHGGIRLLNFAYLSIESSAALLGTGSFSKVYSGFYKHHAVAIKMLFTQDLNPDVIKRYCNEARLLSELASPQHVHVVRIYGVAVLPPSVCMVLERCRYGSLSDVIRGVSIPGSVVKTPLLLTMADRMYLALGCAKGVQAVHEYAPDLCHRDIKSFNFLIDWQLHAKIADLELGEKETIFSSKTSSNDSKQALLSSIEHPTGTNNNSNGKNYKQNLRRSKGTHTAHEAVNVTWQSPEVLLGQGYTQAADIYSLGLVLWEIIASSRTVKKFVTPSSTVSASAADGENMRMTVQYDSIPFSDMKSQSEIAEKIVRGYRPAISIFQSSHSNGSIAEDIDPLYLNIIQQCWAAESNDRPSIAEVVKVLRHAWLFTFHRIMRETEYMVDLSAMHTETRRIGMLFSSTLSDHSKEKDREFETNSNHEDGNNNSSKQSVEALSPLIFPPSQQQQQQQQSGHLSSARNNNNNTMPAATAARNRRSSNLKSSGSLGAPSKSVLDAVRPMQKEPHWQRLEEEGYSTAGSTGGVNGNNGQQNGNYLVLTPSVPYAILWATRKWTQLTGYRVNDVLALSVDAIMKVITVDRQQQQLSSQHAAQQIGTPPRNGSRSGSSSEMSMSSVLQPVLQYAAPNHFMAELTRRDGKLLTLSVHAFPVFLAAPTSTSSSRDHSFAGSSDPGAVAAMMAVRNSGSSDDITRIRSSSGATTGGRELKTVVSSTDSPVKGPAVIGAALSPPQQSLSSMLGSFKLPPFLTGGDAEESPVFDDPQPHPGDVAYIVLQVSLLNAGKE